ncbi:MULTISPECIES: metalloregulator ArsR/SmtB family transcription factor [Paenibacillus]|uniref:ArsR family transcriptional regulator n=1 Tax=Paenibacillus odorifer TaxID=189426 RepID=A0A1R0Y3B8_9BACL|nr:MULTISPECIES: metalloregulator ArsR/SmtB family transcription factor [Paenibacillus]AIQ36218.1 ArsR family transcriptional regulator [Paenibacillus sp. FSL R5-0345]OMD41740.1 ArsR family transcriptional regulator [Paenibacillus odorifer]
MQLEKIVNYHKALADPTRLRLLLLLSQGEMHGQALAEKLNLSQPTVTHHAAKLREAALIKERRDKNTVYFKLNPEFISSGAEASLQFIFSKGARNMEEKSPENSLKESVLRNFFSKDGRLRQIPAQYKKKLIALQYMVEKLEPRVVYTEKEINEFIKQFHEDFATIRREFIMHQFMYRENDKYELNPREIWTRWEDVK